jgi:hypothetical protein
LNYLPFTVSISQTNSLADSAVIVITGGAIYGSSISFDELILSPLSAVFEFPSLDPRAYFYPNPTHEKLVIHYFDGTPFSAMLYDRTGKWIASTYGIGNPYGLSETFAAPREVEIPVGQLSSGIYFLHIKSQRNEITQRVVLEN